MTFEIHIMVLLFVAELVLVLSGLSAFLAIRMLRKKPTVRASAKGRKRAQSKGGEEGSGNASHGWLQLELEKIRESLYALNEMSELDEPKQKWKEVLEMREELLQTEQKAEKNNNDKSVWRAILKDFYGPLLTKGDAANGFEGGMSEQAIEAVTRSEEEISRLRGIIDNQHGLVGGLKKELSELGEDAEKWEGVAQRIDGVKHSGEELSRCANVLEYHNSVIKGDEDTEMEKGPAPVGEVEVATAEAAPGATPVEGDDAEDLYGLKSIIGDQQETIGRLHAMLDELVPEAERTGELADMLDSIQAANNELIACVAILETENDRLTHELEMVRANYEEVIDSADASGEEEYFDDESEEERISA